MEDYLPISMLNQLEYCERRFYLMHVLGEMEVNAHVLEGSLRHENAHTPGRESEDGLTMRRKVYVWSDELQIAGYTDVVEERSSPDGRTEILPVEYKKGRMGKWLNDHIQLCAQALCLMERTGAVIPKGYIFYFGSRRREEVAFTPELRQRTAQSIARAHELTRTRVLPAPLENYNKCRDCSLEPICLPREVRQLRGACAARSRRKGAPRQDEQPQ
jgi:CRISPR-associated exonuclease Cas4